MTQVTVNGNTYSDDGSTAKDMGSGGHRTHLLPMLGDAIADLAAKVAAALGYKNAAEAAAIAAAQAVASLPDGTINDGAPGATKAWSSQKVSTELAARDAATAAVRKKSAYALNLALRNAAYLP